MKKKSMIKYIVPMLLVLVAATAWFGTKQAAGAVQYLEKIEASYYGNAVEVGEEINIKDIYLMAEYYIKEGNTGYYDYGEVKKGFTISPNVIKKEGENRITVTYQEKSCILIVPGKSVVELTANYLGDDLYIGAEVPTGKVEVFAQFSDGSYGQVKNFSLVESKITKEGINSLTVKYKGKTTEIEVFGKLPLAVEEIHAEYHGGGVIAGNSLNKADFSVMAYYNDGTVKDITNFSINPTVVEKEGYNQITVSYGDIKTTVEITAAARTITSMRAAYLGGGVIIGREIKKEEIEVIVTYNDSTEAQIEDYQIMGGTIQYEGANTVLVYVDSFMQELIVPGVKGFVANYDNPVSNYFSSPDELYHTKVTLGMSMEVGDGKFFLEEADPKMLRYMVRRVVQTQEYLGFMLGYEDDEMVLEFPMAMKVTVPEEFDPEKFAVYYTPNQKTIMAKVAGDFVDEEKTEFEFVVHEPGAYIIVQEEDNALVTEIIVEKELELKENRNYALNPIVYPLTAVNREVTYSSTDEDVATVSPNGKIRTHSAGVCEIWIEAQDESGVYAIVTVEVTGRKKRK